jgi:hypothetical protein
MDLHYFGELHGHADLLAVLQVDDEPRRSVEIAPFIDEEDGP